MTLTAKLRNCRSRRAFRRSSANSRFFLWHLKNCYWPELASAEHFASEFSRSNQGIFFVRLGAEKDILNDTIHKIIRRDKWQGIIIEPSPDVFDELVKPLYQKQEGITLIQTLPAAKEVVRLLKELNTTVVDWLQTGMGDLDFEIIKAIDQENIQLRVIVFENDAMKPETMKECVLYLSGKKYKVKRIGGKTVAALEPDEYLARFLAE